jgi:hypothetical protein
MELSREVVIRIAEASIIETIEAFVRFRPGFHGDTGIRDYLYHRLMTGLPNGGTHTRPDGGGTLVVQAEWYTVLKYCNTGNGASRGRFDIGVADPEELDSAVPRPLMTFECGRNKSASVLLSDVDAAADHEGPSPADITKLAREIKHATLPLGYALEFYDDDHREADRLTERVREWISTSKCDGLRVVVLSCRGGEKPSVRFLPESWARPLSLEFAAELKRIESLSCVRRAGLTVRVKRTGESHTNRISQEAFLCSCSSEARLLIECIERQFRKQVKFVFGGSSMTVNRWPSGKLLRINRTQNTVSECHPAITHELAMSLHESIPRSTYGIGEADDFRTAVIAGIGKTLSGGIVPMKAEPRT